MTVATLLEPGTVAMVTERIKAHYEVQDLEMGKVYRWCPESIVVECKCGKKLTLTASKNVCGQCDADHRAIVEEALEARLAEYEEEVDHPWHYPRPYYVPTRGA